MERRPISIEYRGHRILSVPAPGGGTRLLRALRAMNLLWPDAKSDSVDLWYTAIAKSVYAALREAESEPALQVERYGETTHLCIADSDGNIVALTQSIQSLFGAKVANDELGFFYNNYLCTCPRFRHPSQLRSRCQPRSNVAPTLVLKDGRPLLVAGAAGSRRIISALLQTLSGVIDRGLEVRAAVAAPRVHALASRRVWIESPAATDRLLGSLSKHIFGCQN